MERLVWPTEAEIDAALASAPEDVDALGRSFRDRHTSEAAREIAELCLTLGRPVSDLASSGMMRTVVRHLLVLQQRIDDLEARLTDGQDALRR